MRYLEGSEADEARGYLLQTAQVARGARCYRSKCGALIVKDGNILGTGVNSPPREICLARCLKDDLPQDFKSDRTCCVHAEQRAIFAALRNAPEDLPGARLYFIRLDAADAIKYSGKPYCTICSKASLDVNLAEFVLWHPEGIAVYDTDEYNTLSFQFRANVSSPV